MPLLIDAPPGSIKEGLFGGVFLYVFEVLPYLHARGIYPAWKIASKLYGRAPDYTVIPGLLDLAYAPPIPTRRVEMPRLRARHTSVLGSDWQQLHRLWHAYFAIPARYHERLAPLGDLSRTLGVHYRGHDKVVVAWDSNPVSHADFLGVVCDLLAGRPSIERLLVATDDQEFLQYVQAQAPLPVLAFGAGAHHFHEKSDDERWREAERAVVDCLALSRCGAVLATSSALSSFAKILNPGLAMYRCAASRMFSNIPYFPIAYIPAYRATDPEVQGSIDRMMAHDWSQRPEAAGFAQPFFHRPRPLGPRQRLRNLLLGPLHWLRQFERF